MRGLLMVECLYHQTVKGVKTQTRRSGGLEAVNIAPDQWCENPFKSENNEWHFLRHTIYQTEKNAGKCYNKIDVPICKPRYKVGEVLYLKEPIITNGEHIEYKFDYHPFNVGRVDNKWSNKLFMPASAARAYVRITGIRCERLLDISDEDCIAEGIDHRTFVTQEAKLTYYLDYQKQQYNCSAKNSFISLFKFANKVKEVPNLWVWAYTFEYLKDYQHE